MIRFIVFIAVMAGALYLAAFYKLGDKPLAGHLNDIYRSPVVQEKLHELSTGVDKRVHHIEHDAEKVMPKKSTEPRVHRQTADAEPLPHQEIAHHGTEHAAVVHAERPQPAQDKLTDDDRASLDHLLAKKLGDAR
jgi:hypothetical protein